MPSTYQPIYGFAGRPIMNYAGTMPVCMKIPCPFADGDIVAGTTTTTGNITVQAPRLQGTTLGNAVLVTGTGATTFLYSGQCYALAGRTLGKNRDIEFHTNNIVAPQWSLEAIVEGSVVFTYTYSAAGGNGVYVDHVMSDQELIPYYRFRFRWSLSGTISQAGYGGWMEIKLS